MKKKGFTLIELLIVIAIIAILAGMLLPVLEQAQTKTKLSVCANNLKQIDLALHMYANDYDGFLPPYSGPYIAVSSSNPYINPQDAGYDITQTVLGSYYVLTPEYITSPKIIFCEGGKTYPKSVYTHIDPSSGKDYVANPSTFKPGLNDNYNHCNVTYAYAGWGGLKFGKPNTSNYLIASDQNYFDTFKSPSGTVRWNAPVARFLAFGGTVTTNNHSAGGINVLFINGSVRWLQYVSKGSYYTTLPLADYLNWNNLRNP